jgi:hypothetical protein
VPPNESRFRTHRCDGCGGPLPEPDVDTPALTCPFCGLVTELKDRPAPVVVSWDLETSARQAGSRIKLALRLGVALAAVVVAFVVLRALRPMTDAIDDVRRQGEEIRESMREVAPHELAALEPGVARPVVVDPPPGGFAAFDPVVRLDWVLPIAKAWKSDATLERIDGGPITTSGTIDLSSQAEAAVSYRFLSAERIAAWTRDADRVRNLEVDYRLELVVARAKAAATVTRGRPMSIQVPPTESLMPMPELLSRARTQAGFVDRPAYLGELVHYSPNGWVWRLATLSGRERLPMIRARDGRVGD